MSPPESPSPENAADPPERRRQAIDQGRAAPRPVRLVASLAAALHEGALMRSVEAHDRQLIVERIRETNLRLATGLGTLSLLFALLLFWLDWERWRSGRFDASPVYLALFAAHGLFASSTLPGIVLWWRRAQSIESRAGLLDLHIFLFLGSLALMGVLGLVERGSMVLLGLALLVGNLVYSIPLHRRRIFNACIFLGGLASVLTQPADSIARLIQLAELLGLVNVCAFAGHLHSRHRVAAILAESRYAQLSMVDALTGVASRRRLQEVLERELGRVAKGHPLSLVVIDVDHFKAVNDTHGHEVGDDVLRGLTRLLQQQLRLADVIGRWGGEEFVVVCTDTPAAEAAMIAERLRRRLAEHAFDRAGVTTASFGVASALPGDTVKQLFERADKALYAAKHAGRNRVVLQDAA